MPPARTPAPPRDTFGPHDGPDEVLPSWPSERYATGVLYAPQMPAAQRLRDVDEATSDGHEAPRAPPQAFTAARRPSVMGLTFSLEGAAPSLVVTATAAAYAPTRAAAGTLTWTRRPLAIAPPAPVTVREGLHEVATVGHARWWLRGVRCGPRWDVTVALENVARPGASRVEAEGLHLFQVAFEVAAVGDARIVARGQPAGAVDEDALLFDLLQRDAATWAFGRSCEASWRFADGRCVVSTAPPERHPGPSVRLRSGSLVHGASVAAALDLTALAETSDAGALASKLDALPRAYAQWLEQQADRIDVLAAAGHLSPSRASVARNNLTVAHATTARIRRGIDALSRPLDDAARRAFQLSQRASLLARRGGPGEGSAAPRWDAWQLAFQLAVIGDLATSSRGGEVMDVLSIPARERRWAAYLALSTFTLFLRRLRASADDPRGVSVLLRPSGAYLPWHGVAAARRAVRACEALRRDALHRGDATLGLAPVSLAVCAKERASFEAVRGPWSDAADPDDAALPDILVGDAATCGRLRAEEPCAGGFPVLVVQDEMDLLQGPRGAIAGVHDAVVDLLLSRDGERPKVIGSSAATCGIQSLTRSLFDRRAARFPPPVLDADDTGFVALEQREAAPAPRRRADDGVEPFSARARDRALRPAMVALARGAQTRAPNSGPLDDAWRARCDHWVDAFLDRVERIAPDERLATSCEAEALLDAWQRCGAIGGETTEAPSERPWCLVAEGGVRSALDIPPFSPDPSYRFGSYWSMIRDANPAQRRLLVQVASEMLKEPADVLQRVVDEWAETQASDPKDEDVRVAEYRQFARALREPIEKPEFDTRPEPVPAEFGTLLEGVALARRLREVRAQVAFTRIAPPGGMFRAGGEAPYNLSRAKLPWLPAIELRGEGIFLGFHPEAIAAWENESINTALKAHFDRFAARFRREALAEARTEGERAEVSARVDAWRPHGPRFVMLHSFAHALMRQLSLACGYSSSALRERIYVADEPARQMGVLVHTDSPDSEGTLGGLVRQGRRERLRDTLVALLHDAAWCSSDPVCITGAMTLSTPRNGAACHACLLAPETSCEHFNTLLDRALLVGTPNAPKVGFFGHWLREHQ
ncbi:MAG: DUF1998 domain-containing protein [Polyangiales bacterium]